MFTQAKSICLTTLLLLSLMGLTFPVKAQTQEPTLSDPLLPLLALIPDTPDLRASMQIASYVNYRAVAAGLTLPASSAALTDNDKSAYFHALLRIRTGSEMQNYLRYLLDKMPTTDGFDWFDIDGALEYGLPPNIGLILSGKFDAAKIGSALSARAFQKTTVEGVTVWSRYDDFSVHLDALEPSDPFGGHLGLAARVAILPGVVANTRSTHGTTAIVNAYKHINKSLADAPEYRALSGAISDPQTYKGALVQAAIYTPEMFTYPAAQLPAILRAMSHPPALSDYGTLPPYRLAALADRQEGKDQVSLAVLVYPDVSTAQSATTELQKRIAGFDPVNEFDRVGAKVDLPHVYKAENGLGVVVISIRYPLPSTTPDGSGLTKQAGLIFAEWMRAVNMGQFLPLDLNLPAK